MAAWILLGNVAIHSQGNFVNLNYSGLNWQLRERRTMSCKGDYESETYLDRFLDKRKFWRAYIEVDNRYTQAEKNKDGTILKPAKQTNLAAVGMAYLLPLFVIADGRVDHKGNFPFQIGRDFPLTKRIGLDALWNTDREYEMVHDILLEDTLHCQLIMIAIISGEQVFLLSIDEWKCHGKVLQGKQIKK